jgi:hypothetical protein
MAIECRVLSVSRDVSATKSIKKSSGYEYLPWLLISATLYNKKNRYFYVKLLLSRTLDFFMLFVALTSRLTLNTLHSIAIAV